MWPWNLIDDIERLLGTSSTLHQAPLGEFELELLSGNAQFWSKPAIFAPCDLEIWWMTLKNNRAPFLWYIMLCASFQSHRWIQTKVTLRKRLIWVKIGDLLSRGTSKFDEWPWKTIGHLFYFAPSFVYHFITIGEFKLKLEPGNARFGSKSVYFLSCVNLKFDEWPWKTIGHLFYATSSFMHHFEAIGEFKLESQSGNAQFGQNRRFLEPCDLEIWWMTLKNSRAPLPTSSFMHHFIIICEFKLELESGNG